MDSLLSLADGLSSEGYEVDGLVTHSDKDNFEAFKELTSTMKYVGNLNKFTKYFAVLSFIWKSKPDVIMINYNAVVHFLLPFIPKSTVIDIIHSDADDFYRISKINHSRVDTWVAPTPGVKKGFVDYANLQRAKQDTIVISHGISESKTKRTKQSKDELNLAFVGAVYEHKGADLLPEIMEKILKDIPYAKLRIIGTGKLESELKKEFAKKQIDSNIEFMGVMPHEEVRKVLAHSDILLFPTRVEAFGLVIAEAMMEGAVPIVTLLPGITDATVENSRTGFLIKKDNIDAFAQRIVELGKDVNLLIEMSNASKTQANEYLSLERMIHNYINLMDKRDK